MSRQAAPKPKTLNLGDAAPNFSLADQKGERHSLFEYRSEWVVLYFLDKKEVENFTSGEDNALRKDFIKIKQRRVYVLGVSSASIDEHLQFARTHGISVRLLSDPDKKVMKLYGVVPPTRPAGRGPSGFVRTSFVISPQGNIAKIYKNTEPGNVDQILSYLTAIPETQSRRVAPEDMKVPGMPERRFSLE